MGIGSVLNRYRSTLCLWVAALHVPDPPVFPSDSSFTLALSTMPSLRARYSPIQRDPCTCQHDCPHQDEAALSASRGFAHLFTWAVIICTVCTVMNAAFLASTFRLGSTESSSIPAPTREDTWRLRRPSQYINLDSIQRPVPPTPRHFDNFPLSVTQADSFESGRVIESHTKEHMGASGLFVPDERQVLVTKQVSSTVRSRGTGLMGILDVNDRWFFGR